MMVLTFILLVSVCTASPLQRIVGGSESDENEWPWQLSLQYHSASAGKYHICGAALLSEYYAVTAAHCVNHDRSPSKYEIIAGEHDFNKLSFNEQHIPVESLTMHPNYIEANGFPNDIAILKLAGKVQLSEKITTANLPDSTDFTYYNNRVCFITGWGRLSGGGPTPSILNEANTTVISDAQCRNFATTFRRYVQEDKHICIHTGHNGACNGDSGGPLVCFVNGIWQLAGITSWGISNCPTTYPSVYTRISNYLEFIDSHIKQP